MFRYLQIETTTFCNASCWFCPNSEVENKTMDDTLLYDLIDQTRGMSIVYRPFGLGEPFVDVRMGELCKYIKQDKTATIEIHTNGEALSEAVQAQLDGNVDLVRFSIDGYADNTIARTRKVNPKIVKANAERFIRENPNVEIEVRMIDLPGTLGEQELFVSRWNELRPGCAKITELYEHPWESQTESINLPCLKVQNEIFVYVDGTVHLCPWDFEHREVLGDANDELIAEIWDYYTHKRKALLAGDRDSIGLCSRCNATF